MEKSEKISSEILDFYYNELKFERLKTESLKEMIKEHFYRIKEETLEEDGEFDLINIDGVILHEKKNTNYVWNDDFYEELINCGKAHIVLKHGDSLNKRFDLSTYVLPKDPNNDSLHFSTASVQSQYDSVLEAHEKKINLQKVEWEKIEFEVLVDQYMRSKKKLELKENKYDVQKNSLFRTMKEENIHKVNGFSIKEESTTYDFGRLYGEVLVEKVEIVTNGFQSIDLFNDKPIELTEEDLFDAEIIKKSIRKKERIELFKKHLGEEYYYVVGYRKEDDILKRFPISTSKVEELVENDESFNYNVIETARDITSEDDIKLNLEIITEEALTQRKTVWYQRQLERGLKASGYYDN